MRAAFNRDYVSLKAEVKEVETVKRNVDYIMREARPRKQTQKQKKRERG